MSGEINVISRTQLIVVDAESKSVSVVSAGPQGPAGASADNIYVSATPPSSPSVNDLWVDVS